MIGLVVSPVVFDSVVIVITPIIHYCSFLTLCRIKKYIFQSLYFTKFAVVVWWYKLIKRAFNYDNICHRLMQWFVFWIHFLEHFHTTFCATIALQLRYFKNVIIIQLIRTVCVIIQWPNLLDKMHSWSYHMSLISRWKHSLQLITGYQNHNYTSDDKQ